MRAAIAPAKINLALHVGALQQDGYHPVDTVCAFLDIGERVEILDQSDEFTLDVVGADEDDVPSDDRNLIIKGAMALASQGEVSPVRFRLHKTAPSASGIGAGTSDGAAAMVLLNQTRSTPLSSEAMMRLSLKLGADGPVCMARQLFGGQLIKATGIGELISVPPQPAPFWMCIANPRRAVPTGAVFQTFDREDPPAPFSTRPLERGFSPDRLASWVESHRNDLQLPASQIEPDILPLVDKVGRLAGTLVARMSGSGATVFGLYADGISARRAEKALLAEGYWATSGRALDRALVEMGRS